MTSNSQYSNLDVEMRPDNQIKLLSRKQRLWFYIFITSVACFITGCFLGFLIGRNKKPDNDINNNDSFKKLSLQLQNNVKTDFLVSQLQYYSSEIHQAGSQRNIELAETMVNNWKSWGLSNSTIDKYGFNKTIPNPKHRSFIQLVHNNGTENSIEIPTSELNDTLLRYHSYSSSGNVQGRFVFINYGLKGDLQQLKSLNVPVCGSDVIPIVRLGFSFRTAKVKHLVSHCGDKNLPGALLVYPDPWDYAVDQDNSSSTPDNTPVYPHSWWLPGDAAVFGNMKMKSGLQSPQLPSMKGIFNTVPLTDMLTPFPVQPISYNDAKVLFSKMDRISTPTNWRKSISRNIVSSNDWSLHVNISNVIQQKQLANVIGVLPGTNQSENWVLLGNHRDAWAYGTSDPGSGTAILQGVVKVLAEAYKQGIFQPRRSIIFANWDGEEEGLLGSTEFTNQFAQQLSARAVAYINMDCPVKGNFSFNARTTPLLESAFIHSTMNVQLNSSTKETLYSDWLKKLPLPGSNNSKPMVNDLGGGSDHVNFAYILGIPGSYPEYRFIENLPSMPAYHTKYDNMDMMLNHVDKNLQHHNLITRFMIDYIIRLSNTNIIPFDVRVLAKRMRIELPGLRKKLTAIQKIRDINYTAILEDVVSTFSKVTDQFYKYISDNYKTIVNNPKKLREINDVLLRIPRSFLVREGLPSRYRYQNILIATKLSNSYMGSFYTGVYDAMTLYNSGQVKLEVIYRQLSLLTNSIRVATQLMDGGLTQDL